MRAAVEDPGRPLVVGQICLGAMGGSSRMACRLANALSRRGHEVHLYCLHRLPWPLDPAVRPRVCRRAAPTNQHWAQPDREAFTGILASDIASRDFDVLHYHYAVPFAGLVARVAALTSGPMPVVVGTLHGTDVTGSLRNQRALSTLKRELVSTDVLLTVSHHLSALSEPLALRAPRVLPNFVEDDWPTIHGLGAARPNSPATILHVSNFRAVKDLGLLARVFLEVHQRTGAQLCLVGEGPEMAGLRRVLDSSPAAASVRYAGATPHPEGFFGTATLLLSTSAQESFGLALLEAMAAGVPVAATAVGGVPELVEDEVTGLLFDPEDPDSAIARITGLLCSQTRLEALGRQGRRRAEALRESRVIALYEDLYRQALDRRAEAGPKHHA